MPLENRNLEAGTRLEANYKKVRYVCTVEAAEEGEGIAFVLADGKRFKSPSAAASAVMGGGAVNGWRFWSLEGDAKQPAEAEPKPAAAKKARKPKAEASTWLIYKVPNQKGTPEGKEKFFCVLCVRGFLVDAGTTPEVCPEGHPADDPEVTSAVGATSAGEEAAAE